MGRARGVDHDGADPRADYWADYQHKANKLEDLNRRIERVKEGDVSAVFPSLHPESWHSLQLAARYASMPKESQNGPQPDQPEDLSRRCQDMNFCLSVFNPTAPYDDETFQHTRQTLTLSPSFKAPTNIVEITTTPHSPLSLHPRSQPKLQSQPHQPLQLQPKSQPPPQPQLPPLKTNPPRQKRRMRSQRRS